MSAKKMIESKFPIFIILFCCIHGKFEHLLKAQSQEKSSIGSALYTRSELWNMTLANVHLC